MRVGHFVALHGATWAFPQSTALGMFGNPLQKNETMMHWPNMLFSDLALQLSFPT